MLYQLSHFRPGSLRAMSRDGAEGQDRTGDTGIFSPVLYQLSYLGPLVRPRRRSHSCSLRRESSIGGQPRRERDDARVY